MPLSKPIQARDGAWIDHVVVPKDTTIVVGIQGVNRNTALWGDDALEWRPERWLEPLPTSLTDARIPGVYSNLYVFHGSLVGIT